MLRAAIGMCALCACLEACAVRESGRPNVGKQDEPAVAALSKPAMKRVSNEELLQSLAPRLAQSEEGLAWRKRKDGGYGLKLNGRFRHATIAQRGPDGRLQAECVGNVHAAEHVLSKARKPVGAP